MLAAMRDGVLLDKSKPKRRPLIPRLLLLCRLMLRMPSAIGLVMRTIVRITVCVVRSIQISRM